MRRYGSEANERWEGFEHRPGDIVISTRSKCGTTWLQMVCALLVFGGPDLPRPLPEISPWLDWDVEPLEAVLARLGEQDHRRFIKTHTPLDGLPLRPDVTYLVAGRHPLDVAGSLHAHGRNIDRDRMEALTGRRTDGPEASFAGWFRTWMRPPVGPSMSLDTLPGLVHHLADAWAKQDELDVVLVHYDDLTADLEGQARRLADRLGVAVPEASWPDLVRAAGFEAMRADAERTAPDHLGVLQDRRAFFRSAAIDRGAGRITTDLAAECEAIVEDLAPPDLAAWLLR